MTMESIAIERIEGLSLVGQSLEPKSQQVQVRAFLRTRGGSREAHLVLPLLDALYLLNMLEAMSADANLDHLRRPPATSAQ